MRAETNAALVRNGYPVESMPGVHVGLESRENIDKAGGWYQYFR